MVKNLDSEIIEIINQYIAEIKKHYRLDYVFLFGSFANGTPHADSDIDIAIISSDIKGVYGERLNFMRFTRKIDLRIEPHPISIEDYKTNATSLVNEIKQHGIQLYTA